MHYTERVRPLTKFIPGIVAAAFDPRVFILAVTDDFGNLVPLNTRSGSAHYLGVVTQEYH